MNGKEYNMKKIIAFGIGYQLEKMINRNYLKEYDIVAFCDNDCKKWGENMKGKESFHPIK